MGRNEDKERARIRDSTEFVAKMHPLSPPDPTRFILVDTSHPGNVGATARAMKVMGFSELVLVRPRFADVLVQEDTVAMASGAADILVRARIVDTVAEALEGVTFAIAPTADAAAPTTEVTVKGELRGRAISSRIKNGSSTTDFDSRARISVNGKTATSVGEVGAFIRLNQSDAGNVDANKAYGWWQVSPELQLLAGRTDSIGAVEAGAD